MVRYRSAIDILQIAVIPDHRFLWWTCSLCLFLSACPNVSVDLQQSDSAVVPLPSPCGRVLGQVALAPSLISQSVWLVQTSLALYTLFACVSVSVSVVYVLWYSGVCQHKNKTLWARRGHTHTMLSDNFLAFTLSLLTDRYVWAT